MRTTQGKTPFLFTVKYTEERTARDTPESLNSYRKASLKIAKDFNYGDYYIQRIKKAETSDQIADVMKAARNSEDCNKYCFA